MEQLLNIKTVPISLEYKIESAKLQLKTSDVQVEVLDNGGERVIKGKPIRLVLDGTNVSKSEWKTYENMAKYGRNRTYRATGNVTKNGSFELNVFLDDFQNEVNYISENPLLTVEKTAVGRDRDGKNYFYNPLGNELSPETEAAFLIRYEMEKAAFDLHRAELEFIPGSFEIIIKEYPKVIVEYVGSPIYVPPSSDPDYVPAEDAE